MSATAYYRSALRRIAGAKRSFLNVYLKSNQAASPSSWRIYVDAYLVLSHAAFEECLELISIWALHQIKTDYISNRETHRALATTFALNSDKFVETDERQGQQIEYELIRKRLIGAVTSHSIAIKDNNGIDEIHRRKLLVPVGLYRKPDVFQKDALQKLIEQRHLHAHLGHDEHGERDKAASRITSPEDALDIVRSTASYFAALVVEAERKYGPTNTLRHKVKKYRRFSATVGRRR